MPTTTKYHQQKQHLFSKGGKAESFSSKGEEQSRSKGGKNGNNISIIAEEGNNQHPIDIIVKEKFRGKLHIIRTVTRYKKQYRLYWI